MPPQSGYGPTPVPVPRPFGRIHRFLGAYDVTFFLGFRVKMQPQTTSAIIAATKIPSCSCCIVVFSVVRTPLWGRAKPLQRLAYCSVSAAAVLLSATAELRSDIKLLLSVPFTCDPGHSACGRPIPRRTRARTAALAAPMARSRSRVRRTSSAASVWRG